MDGDEFAWRVLESELPTLTPAERDRIARTIGQWLNDKLLDVKCSIGGPEHSAVKVGTSVVEFTHTAANLDAHLFISNTHDPALCPECIRPGTLNFNKGVV